MKFFKMMEEAEEENNIGINIRKSQKLDKTDRKVIRAINKISKDVGGAVIFSKNPTNVKKINVPKSFFRKGEFIQIRTGI